MRFRSQSLRVKTAARHCFGNLTRSRCRLGLGPDVSVSASYPKSNVSVSLRSRENFGMSRSLVSDSKSKKSRSRTATSRLHPCGKERGKWKAGMGNEKEGEGRHGRKKNADRHTFLVTASLDRLHQKRGAVFYHFRESEQVRSPELCNEMSVTQAAK